MNKPPLDARSMTPEDFFDLMGVPYQHDGGRIIVVAADVSGKRIGHLPDLREVAVSGNFSCHDNQLRSLEGSPVEIGGYFACDDNWLKSLEGGPSVVHGAYSCSDNNLRTLKGAPSKARSFTCSNNKHLESFEGAEHMQVAEFVCSNGNRIRDFTHLPAVERVIINGEEQGSSTSWKQHFEMRATALSKRLQGSDGIENARPRRTARKATQSNMIENR